MRSLFKTSLIASLCCAAIALATRPVAAQSPYCYGGGYGYGWGYDVPYERDHIPFYAVHPPVYYSYPVARAYGWTPFAYSPDAVILPLEEGGAKQIINPFVPPSNVPVPTPPTPNIKAKPSAERTTDDSASTIHVVVNPYVGSSVADGAE
jgi:hypothetical protein